LSTVYLTGGEKRFKIDGSNEHQAWNKELA